MPLNLKIFSLLLWLSKHFPSWVSAHRIHGGGGENGQRYWLATMAKDTDCPGWGRGDGVLVETAAA